ncbi:hypothetical protein CWI38_0808p0010 [Hamiltosporidium tvaerminnensis]|uniref:Leucine-rich repeat-containing protein n=1 Tax=Hamiltosporidium tvaerminnensis TaxID=1176355 RepID=A0A4Q9LUI4_9MICR|nr:hypothetical protein CWI38_0808p0010 [Hamiltosporidium tvaerminnensis]
MRKRISADGKYYSEHKDSDTAYDFLKSDSCINDVKTHFSSVFEARKKIKKNYIKFIEFERVNLPSFDFFYLRNLKKLEYLSGCNLDDTQLDIFTMNTTSDVLLLEFFDDSRKLIQISNQPSLHFGTKEISLAGNEMQLEIIHSLKNFKVLEYLNFSNLKNISMENFYCDCGFKLYLVEIDLLEICYLEVLISVKKLELAKNNLTKFDIYQIYLFSNHKYMRVSFNAEVFSDFVKTWGFSFYNVNSDICNFLMIQLSLKNLKFIECKIEAELWTDGFRTFANSLETVTVMNKMLSE